MGDRLIVQCKFCVSALASILVLAGCGRGDGLDRHRITGKVTFQGKPVEYGSVFFEPHESVGQVAPTSYLAVRDGQYDAGDEGPIKGKYWVVVGGMDQSKNKVDSDGVTMTAPLFNHYRFAVEIPTPNNTLDIEVPASQKIKGTK